MNQTFLTKVNIRKVRHLEGISIPLSTEKKKHLLLTGKNGSGKTSVLEALVKFFQFITSDSYDAEENIRHMIDFCKKEIEKYQKMSLTEQNRIKIQEKERNLMFWENKLQNWTNGAGVECASLAVLREKFQSGEFILAYYGDRRKLHVEEYKSIEKIQLKKNYSIQEAPGAKFTKYLVDLRATQHFTKDAEKANRIDNWFLRFESVLKELFEDADLKLQFDEDSFQFTISETGREPFDFNTVSSGYAAVLEIVSDLMIRMEAQSKLRDSFDLEGVVLIDEIETHLHLELQKKILPMLTKLFPNLQFVITTHSPFILSSLEDAVIYDLENNILLKKGLKNLPYEGIVEGYFGVDTLNDELRNRLEQYRELVNKKELSDEEYAQIDELESALDEIPDGLAPTIAVEYSRLKLEFSNRG